MKNSLEMFLKDPELLVGILYIIHIYVDTYSYK